jgi:hypothetical protein
VDDDDGGLVRESLLHVEKESLAQEIEKAWMQMADWYDDNIKGGPDIIFKSIQYLSLHSLVIISNINKPCSIECVDLNSDQVRGVAQDEKTKRVQ